MTDSLGAASGSIELEGAQALATLKQVESGIRNLGSVQPAGAGGLSGFVKQHQQAITTLGTGIAAIGAVTLGAFGIGTKVALDFEAQMSAVGSVANATKGELADMRDEALRLGASTVFSASESAQAMEIMIKAGATYEQVMDGATEHVMNLAAATGTEVPLAAETAAAAVNVFGADYERVANVIAQSSNASALDVNDWALAMKGVAPVAAKAGMSIEDTAAAMMILADNGIAGEVSSTALRNILLNLGNDANKGTKALHELGIATRDASGAQRSMADVTQDLAAIWPSLSASQRDKIALDLAGRDGVVAFNAVMDEQVEALENGSDAFTDNRARLNDAGTAADGAAKRMDNLRGSLEEFFGGLETLTIKAFSPLLTGFRGIVDVGTSVVRLLNRLPEPVLATLAAFTGLAGVFAVVAGATLLALPKIVEIKGAFEELRGSASKLPMLSGIFGRMSSGMMDFTASVRAGDYSVRNLTASMRQFIATQALSIRNFARLHPLMLGFGLIAAGIGAAYMTNFLGIGDAIDGVVAKVKTVGKSMLDAFRGSGDAAAIAEDQVAQYAKATKVVDGVTVWTAFRTNADGVVEEVGEIVESTESLDGKTTRVKIKGEDGEYWATIDLATGQISDAEISVGADTRPFTQKVNDALQVLEDSLRSGGYGWAADIVNNVQGIVSAVGEAAAAIREFVGGLGDQFNGLLEAVGLGGVNFGNLAKQIAAVVLVVAPLVAGLALVLSALAPVGAVLAIIASPVFLIVAALAALGAGLVYAYRNFEPFRKAVDKTASAIKKFTLDRVVPGIRRLGEFLGDAARSVADFLREFQPFQNVISGAVSLIRNLGDAFRALFQGDYRGFASGVAAAFGNLLSIVGNLMITVPTLLYQAFRAIDWGVVGEALVSGFATAWEAVTNVATAAFNALRSAIGDIDWGAVWQSFTATARAAFDAVQGAVGRAVDAITSRFPALGPVFDGVAAAVGWVVSGISNLVGMAIDFATQESTINAFKTTWDLLKGAIDAIGWAIQAVVSFAIDFATQESTVNAFKGVWTFLKDAIDEVVGAIQAVVGYAIDFATSEAAIDAYRLIWDGLRFAVSTAKSAISVIASYIPTFSATTIIDTFKKLWDDLKAAIDSIKGAIDTVAGLAPDFSGITGPIQGIVDVGQKAFDILEKLGGWIAGPGGGGNAEEEGEGSFVDPPPNAFQPKPSGDSGGSSINFEAGGLLAASAILRTIIPLTDSFRAAVAAANAEGLLMKPIWEATPYQPLYNLALGAYTAQQAALALSGGAQTLNSIGTAAVLGFTSAATAGFGTAVSWPAAPLAALASIKGGFGTTLPALVLQSQTSFSAAKAAAVSNIDGMKASVGTSISTMSSSAISTIGAMNLKVIDRASNMSSTVKTAFMDMNTAAATQTSIMNTITGAAFSTMRSNASSAMNAMRSAVSAGMAGVVASVRSGMSSAVAAASGMSGSFFGAGADAIQGLVNGARSRLGALQSVVSQAIAIMARIPSLGNSPWPMMIGAGHDALDGLIQGVAERHRALGRVIDQTIRYFSDASPVLSSSGPGGSYGALLSSPVAAVSNVTTYNVFTLPTDEWVEVATAARTAPQRTAVLMRQARSIVVEGEPSHG